MDFYEFQMYQQMTGGSMFGNIEGWFAIVLLVIFCCICLAYSERIHSTKQFRYAIIVFVLAMMSPAIVDFFFQVIEVSPNTVIRNNSNKEMRWLLLIKSNLRPLLLAISSAMLLFSIAPQSLQIVAARASESSKHPLDD